MTFVVQLSTSITRLPTIRSYYCTTSAPPTPTEISAQPMNVSNVLVTWWWNSSGSASNCFNTTNIIYHPEGGYKSSRQLSDSAVNKTTLTGLQCNTSYTITVVATGGGHRREGVTVLPLQGILNVCANIDCGHMMSITLGPHSLSAAVLSPTSVRLTWGAPCHTQQYHIYYRGACGVEKRLNTNHPEYTLNGLQEGMNYTFTVNQSGFSGGRVLSTGPVYAKTFTTGIIYLFTTEAS